jgi:hypothetical protein
MYTPRQIVQRAGRKDLCDLLKVSSEAPRKWYATGIPPKHWSTLVIRYEWLTYDILARATQIARKHNGKN